MHATIHTDMMSKRAFKKVILKAHPDRGGSDEHAKQPSGAKEAWGKARISARRPTRADAGRDAHGLESPLDFGVLVAEGEEVENTYRLRSQGVLLTYCGVAGLAQWERLLLYAPARQGKKWNVKHWSATLEGAKSGRWHIHLVLQFPRLVSTITRSFWLEGLKPHADQNDLLGAGFSRNKIQDSLNRAMFCEPWIRTVLL